MANVCCACLSSESASPTMGLEVDSLSVLGDKGKHGLVTEEILGLRNEGVFTHFLHKSFPKWLLVSKRNQLAECILEQSSKNNKEQ